MNVPHINLCHYGLARRVELRCKQLAMGCIMSGDQTERKKHHKNNSSNNMDSYPS